jgi:hypothetical protein
MIGEVGALFLQIRGELFAFELGRFVGIPSIPTREILPIEDRPKALRWRRFIGVGKGAGENRTSSEKAKQARIHETHPSDFGEAVEDGLWRSRASRRLYANAAALGCRADRLAVGGDSAGGNLAAGVANIGVNPTVAGEIAPRLEVWLFDFDEDLYGQVIETDLIAFLRPEAKFASLEEMTAQIDDDASMARMILSAG